MKEIEVLDLKREELNLQVGGKSGLLYSFPELKKQGLYYILTSSAWDLALPAGDRSEKEEKAGIFPALKELFYQDLGAEELVLMRQAHTTRILIPEQQAKYRKGRAIDVQSVEKLENRELEAEDLGFALRYHEVDGLLSENSDLITASTHADCAPVIIYDRCKKLLLNLHSGWRGTVMKFPYYSLEFLAAEYGTKPEDLIVILGPMIAAADYEVEADVADRFIAAFPDNKEIIRRRSELKYELDIKAAILSQLSDFGLKSGQVFAVEGSTYRDSCYHSYRRDGADNYSLMMSFTGLVK